MLPSRQRLCRSWAAVFGARSTSSTAYVTKIALECAEELQLDTLLQRDEPAILTGQVLQDWPLLTSWTPRYVAERFGHVQVPVERSTGGADYRNALQTQQGHDHAVQSMHKTFESNHLVPLIRLLGNTSANKDANSEVPKLYFAQNDLCEYIPEFQDGLGSQPQAALGDRLIKRNMWLGPPGISTPLHHDPYHNLYVQVWGSKAFRLYSPQETDRLYPFEARILRNTSQVDAGQPNLQQHPLFSKATSLHGLLKPGEILWMPKGWWHYMVARTASLSVSFWSL